MLGVILIIVGILVLCKLGLLIIKGIRIAWSVVKWMLIGILLLTVGSIAIEYRKYTFPIVVSFVIVIATVIVIKYILKCITKMRHHKHIKCWLAKAAPFLTSEQITAAMRPLITQLQHDDKNDSNYCFSGSQIPYGRAIAFLNCFNSNIVYKDICYFSAVCSKKNEELREYGFIFTTSGIYISIQAESEEQVKYYEIPFNGLYKIEMSNEGNAMYVSIIDSSKQADYQVYIHQTQVSVPLPVLYQICMEIIQLDVPHALLHDTITDIDVNRYADEAEYQSELTQRQSAAADSIIDFATIAARDPLNAQYKEYRNYMAGRQGAGYGAEYANNTLDKIVGKKVINEAQNLDPNTNRQVKLGADRIVNGQVIQTKYCKKASESIGAAFKSKTARYIDKRTNKMMQIEVPRDQYQEALVEMQKRIDSGQVPNVKPGETAKDYVRRGYITYKQAYNVCRAGTIESLTIDVLNGAISCSSVAGISAVVSFAMAVWNGASLEEAANASLDVAKQVIGKGALIYTLTMQLTRAEIGIPFSQSYLSSGVSAGVEGLANPLYKFSEKVAKSIDKSIGKTSFGQMAGLDKLSGKMLISNSVTALIVFGPDAYNALTGRISAGQFLKNSAIGVSGLGGFTLGQALIPIPVLGGLLGSMTGSFVARKVLDNYIEDDAKKMFLIFKEEFIDIVTLSGLTQEEFNEVASLTILNKDLQKILKYMYASQDYRNFAYETISAAVIHVIKKRTLIHEEVVREGYCKVILNLEEKNQLMIGSL